MGRVKQKPGCFRKGGNPRLAVILLASLLAGGTGCKRDLPPAANRPAERATFVQPELPPIPASPFLNVKDATYVGNERCIECHAEEHKNYIHTGMGQSFADVDLADEPPGGEVIHPKSGRSYRIYHKEGQVFHRELALVDGSEQLLGEHPVRYVVGSGHHSRTYLVEMEGFLFESPVTWYPAQEKWRMSPGYDEPDQPGFKRAVGEKCLTCHAGQSEVVGTTLNRMKITEQWISCERCHGPGSLHVKKQLAGSPGESNESFDNTIVNPAHLSRELSEDICSQCHQGFPGLAFVRGRRQADYRPGLPLSSFRLDFRKDTARSQMTEVGHMEQMKRSACYQASQMTCRTCHNPHDLPPRADPVEYHKRNCLGCHVEEACTVKLAVRMAERPDNYCVACHMPNTGTESPHMTFTHHRIGLHKEDPAVSLEVGFPASGPAPELVPAVDLGRFSQLDQDLAMGVACYNLSKHSLAGRHEDAYLARGEKILRQVWNQGLRDGELAALLAELSLFNQNGDYEMYADYALADEKLAAEHRVGVLLVKVTAHFHRNEFAEAASLMKEVTSMRRRTGDWDLLGKYLYRSDQREDAKKAFEKSLQIDPANRPVRLMLEQFER